MLRRIEISARRFWHRVGKRVLPAVLAVGGLAALALASDGSPQHPPPVPSSVPVPAPEPVAATPGCHRLDAGDRSPRVSPRRTRPPERPVPYFAARSGVLPPNGTPVVGGVQLPRGSRCVSFWSTDAGVADAFGLASRLASVFPSTGLWPVIWASPLEEPDAYVYGPGDSSRADPLDAAGVLRRSWRTNGFVREGPFPGIADAADAGRLDVQPFDAGVEDSLMEPAPPGGWLVMLVPVNRPADVYSVLRPATTEYFSDDALTAVLRSWEERFGAVVVALTPSTVELAVGAPPRDEEQARRLAAEHTALMPDAARDELRALPDQLRSTSSARGVTSAAYWVLGWPD